MSVEPRSVGRYQLRPELAVPRDPTRELIWGPDLRWFFDVDRNLKYPTPQFEAELQRAGDIYQLIVTAKTLMRDVCLFADRVDPDSIVGEQLLTLMPGEKFPFVINSKRELSKEQLTGPKVLRCVNEFGVAT